MNTSKVLLVYDSICIISALIFFFLLLYSDIIIQVLWNIWEEEEEVEVIHGEEERPTLGAVPCQRGMDLLLALGESQQLHSLC